MYKKTKFVPTSIKRNEATEGESIEQKMERILINNEPIKDGAPLIYTDREDGVQPQFNIRSDRFDIAIEGMDKVAKTHRATREEVLKARKEKREGKKPSTESGKTEPTQGTSGQEAK